MKGRRHRQHHRPLDALRLGGFHGSLHRLFFPRQDHLAATIVVCGFTYASCPALLGDRPGRVEVDADQRRHRPDANRHGFLHGAAANAQQPRRIGDRQRLSGRERRIFAQRMPCHIGYVALEIDTGLCFERA